MTTGETKPHNQYLYANYMISTMLHIGENKKTQILNAGSS